MDCPLVRWKNMPSLEPKSYSNSMGHRQWIPEIVFACGFFLLAYITARMMYLDSFVDGSIYSNRSFALPGAGFSLLIVLYGCVRLRKVPLGFRLLAAPFAFFFGYLGIGLLFIAINSAL